MTQEKIEQRKKIFNYICENYLKQLEAEATRLAGNSEMGMVVIANTIMKFLDGNTFISPEDITVEMLLAEMQAGFHSCNVPYVAPGYRLINILPLHDLQPRDLALLFPQF